MADLNDSKPVEIPIDGTLDLHPFRPSDISSLISEYIAECRKRGIYNLRIIHGKGTGSLRKGVHHVLERNKYVDGFSLADESGGSWGATLVKLRK